MNYMLTSLLLSIFFASSYSIVDFSSSTEMSSWQIIDDGVMGGKSEGKFRLNEEGHAEFSGRISLKNFGGFSSVRCQRKSIEVKKYTRISLKIKGDGKDYQFRIKKDKSDSFSYVQQFTTSGKWQTLELPLNQFYPSFRGRKLNLTNFSASLIEEITFLIGNKKEEEFLLLIDEVKLI